MTDGNRSAGLWAWLQQSPGRRFSLLTLLFAGFVGGILFWGGYNWAMELSNTETFCTTCHEMQQFVYQEYKGSHHHTNPSGVQAICSDCHVPKAWHHKFVRKIKATNELYHKIIGTISTREKFEAKRLDLAMNVWRSMRATDSRECRNCHHYEAMLLQDQDRFAKRKHERAFKTGETCIDCHQGIAHTLPDDWKSHWEAEFENAD